MSNVNVTINKIEEIIIIMNETIKELVKKRANYFCLPFFYFVHYSFEKMYNE
jgi:hypothetical protein